VRASRWTSYFQTGGHDSNSRGTMMVMLYGASVLGP
jgi:hypothetical protein